ncbi:amidase [Longimicrobium terrae]|uniref:Amidase n=1 Tax=Longimicrobium terrae TaxID=1639882 RepID=A0A841GYB9_9BACT|nr:amidase [Longimicrobium terrae]MBB4636375.1 amidase [Longimicrobium terrae]MBB6070771.1 amidase [Longimicrobium terrae]NNC29751.1 amidase [Longimicrobium terrae]
MPDESLALLSVEETVRRVRAREVSPMDVLEACMARVDRFNPELNAVVTLNPRAREEAEALASRIARGEDVGPLAGVTVGIKDVTEVAGVRTTYGSPLFADHVPEHDAWVVQRLRAAGAIILGKTNTPEFAAGGNTFNPVFGRTRNPWNPARSAGGSTGGGAAGLAAGMFGLAQGTDLGGSLRIPASFCGIVGLRPSVGLVPTLPQDYLWDTLQVTGVMGRGAGDVARGLQAVAGATDRAPLAQPMAERDFAAAVRDADARGLRVAYCRDIAGIGIDAGVERVCREGAFALAQAGAHVEEIDLDLSYGRPAFLALRGHWFVSQLYPHLDKLDGFGPNVANNVRAGLATRVQDLAAGEAARRRIWEQFRDFFSRYDLLLTPTMAVPPFVVEENYPATVDGKEMATYVDWLAPTFVLSLTGLPVASVPAGLDAEGMPVGLQIVAPPRGEERALAAASLVQRLRPIGLPSDRSTAHTDEGR